jgi:hypothetical protein
MLADHLETLLGIGKEALGRLERLPVGAIQPQLLGYADPAGAVGYESLELGKRRAARGVEWKTELVQARPLGDPRARHECQGFEHVQGDDDRVARIPEQAGEFRRAEQGGLMTV